MSRITKFIRQLLRIDGDLYWRVKNLEQRVAVLEKHSGTQEYKMASAHDLIVALTDKVKAQDTVIEGVQTTFATFSAALKEATDKAINEGDMSLLQDVGAQIDAHTASLASAITANTAAQSEPAPSTPVTPVTTDTPLTSDAGATPTSGAAAPADSSAPAATNPAAPTDTPAPASDTPVTETPAAPADGSTPNS